MHNKSGWTATGVGVWLAICSGCAGYDTPVSGPLWDDAASSDASSDVATDTAKVGQDIAAFTPGLPISVEDKKWQYVEVPGTYCRDGKTTGFAINANPKSDKLVIFLEGGGACFNDLTCAVNPMHYDYSPGIGAASLQRDGVNPFADWSFVYIPYCTGDVFSGTAMEGHNGEPQVGYTNIGKFLERIVPTFQGKLSTVVLTGVSAGGFGVAWNWLRVQDAFGPTVAVHALDDSGPPMSGKYLTPCMQQRLSALWGWQDSLHPACTACDLTAGNVVQPLIDVALQRQVGRRFGLLSHDEDSIIKFFYSFGLDNCAAIDEVIFPPEFATGLFPEGLSDLRAHLAGKTNAAVFETHGQAHVVVGSPGGWSASVGGTTALQWFTWFRDGDPKWVDFAP